MVLVVMHFGGVIDSVTPAVCRDYESLHVVASSYVVVVAVEILRLVEFLLTAICGLGDQGLELFCLLLLVAVETLICRH